MANPVTLRHTGALVSAPAASPSALLERLLTTFEATYQASQALHPSVVGATDGAPYVVPQAMANVTVMAIRVLSGQLKVRVTSAAGVDQSINVGGNGVLLWHGPFAGDQITEIKLVGTGDCDILLAGNL